MDTHQVEAERKYGGAALPPKLDRVEGVRTARPAAPQELDAVYYDTPDLRLLHRHITLRRRTGGDDAGWHLKLPRTEDERQEVRLPVGTGGPRDVPAELAERVAAFTRGTALSPVAHLRTHRSRLRLCDGGGNTLAEVTEDRVAAQVLDADRAGPVPASTRPTGPGGTDPSAGTSTDVRTWTEFEVELDHGTPALLDRIEAVFTDGGLTRSPWPSKLSQALDEAPASGGGSPSGPAPGTAGALVMAGFRAQLGALLALDAAVRTGEEDSVHRMRVTARRLRSQLKAHKRLFDRRQTEPLEVELRRLGRLLGRARDQEVLGELLVDGLDAVPAGQHGGELRGQLTERYACGYRSAWRQAVAELDGTRYFTLLERLDAFAADPPLRGRADRKARRYLSDVLRHEQRRTVERLDHALHTAPGPDRDRALHDARKAAKRARYTADHAQPHLPRDRAKRVARFGARMKKLHKVLGTHQDSVVARHELIALTTSGDRAGRRHAFAYGLLHEHHRHIAEAAQRRLPKLRHRAARRKLSRLP
ncbi:CYTH and CHAD domain-containing protein [Kitasatospora sp. NPDC048545]|uniref:CYTH and CHAD domain-containing protein n=1 Tax=Kitasatospora sp. NPDC048545 TaxID=3157208 RepID=UPI0033F4B2CA